MSHSILELCSSGIFLAVVIGIPLVGVVQKQPIYDHFVDGAKDCFGLLFKITPYFVGMYVAISMLRASGAFDTLAHFLAPVLAPLHIPTDLVPLMLLRPFSGAATTSTLAEIANTHGGNSYSAQLAAMMAGSTETTLYVLAVYFASVGIQRIRYALIVGLFADIVGFLASALIAFVWLNPGA